MPSSSESSTDCINCGAAIQGNYCHNCGQTAYIQPITFRQTIADFFSASFSLEGPLLSTIWLLIKNPGKLFREFVEGKRKPYYKPVSFFVLLSAIYIIVRAIINFDPLAGTDPSKSDAPEAAKAGIDAARFMVNNINYIMFFLAFSIGLSFKLFFRKRYSLAEYTAMGFYVGGIYIFVGTILMLIAKYLNTLFNQEQLLFLIIYLSYCGYSLFRKIGDWHAIRYLLASFLSLILYMILGYGFSFLIVNVL